MASKNKSRKLLETTLGKASSSTGKDETLDLSHLRKPIETSIFGLTQVLTLFETATDEVRHYVAHECEILYECRICRTLFRSLANFILHKRSYCRERYRPARNTKEGTIINHRPESNVENPKESKKGVNSILDRLVEEQKNQQLTQSFLLDDCTTKSNSSVSTTEENEIALSIAKIDTTQSAVFQTMVNQSSDSDSLKSEVMEIHSIFENNEAIVGPDGKARVPPNKNAEWHLKCTVCGLKFSTKKTLAYHVKYKHNGAQFIYPCPICKETMANAWSVFRHLFKIHRKTAQQVRKMRDLVHSSAIRKSYAEILSKKNLDLALDKLRHGNQQWMNDFECDSELKMCGGCGKRFERKAALHSHLQVCLKRSVAIKEDNAKRIQGDDKQAGRDSTCLFRDPMKPVGSGKRKPPIVLRRSRQVDVIRRYSDDQDDCKGFGPSEVMESCRIRESCRRASPIGRITEMHREVKEAIPKSAEIITRDDVCLKSMHDKLKTTNGENATNVPIDNITLIIKKDKYGDTKVIRKEKTLGATNRNKGKLIHKTKSSNKKQRITKSGITRKSLVKKVSNNNALPAVVQDKNSIRQEGNDDPREGNASLVIKDAYTYEDINNFHTKSDVIIIDDSYRTSEDYLLSSEDTNRTDSNKSLLTIDNGSTNELNYGGSLSDKNITLRNLLETTPATGNRCLSLKVKKLSDLISTDADNFPSCSNSLDLSLEPLFPDIVIEEDCEDPQSDTKRYITTNDEGGIAKSSTTASLKRKHFNPKLRNFGRKAVKLAKEYKMFIKMAKNHINLKRNECTSCKLRYPTVGPLMQHMALHFHWLRYQCGMCNLMFFEKGDCRSHVVQSHSELESCEIDDTVVALARSKMKSLWTEFQELDYVDEENLNMEEDTSREEHVIVGDGGNKCHYPSSFARAGGFGKPNIQDPQVRDMVMEVIFGISKEDPKDIPNSPESGSSEQLDSNLIENNRPMRSHVKPIQKDFVYEYNFVTKGYGHNMKKQSGTNSADSKEAFLESVPNTLENIDSLLNEGTARLHLKSRPLKVYKKGKEAVGKGLGDDIDEKVGKQTQIDDISS